MTPNRTQAVAGPFGRTRYQGSDFPPGRLIGFQAAAGLRALTAIPRERGYNG